MDTKEMAARLDLSLTTEQLHAAAYLERFGQRFCCEFGYENAVEKARAHWLQRRRDLYRKRIAARKRAH